MHRIVIVGGGIAGLAAAWEVTRCSPPDTAVTVLEAGERLGGKLRRAEVGGLLVDVGAEAMLARRPEAIALVREIGAESQLVTPATTSAAIWSYGALHPIPAGTVLGVPRDPAAAQGILSASEVRRALDDRAPRVEADVSVGEYIAAAMGDAVVDRLVEPLLGGVYAGRARALSLAATMPAIYAAATKGIAPRQAAETAAAGDGGSPGPVFAGLHGGVGRLPDLLGERLAGAGVSIETGTTVRGLTRTPQGWAILTGSTKEPRISLADAVLLAVPAAPTRRLLSEIAPQAAARLGEIETASMAIVTLALPRDGFSGRGSGFLVPPAEGLSIKGSTFSSAKWSWMWEAAENTTFVRASFGRAGEESALQVGDDALVERARDDLAAVLGRPLAPHDDASVQRWGGALPQYAVGHLERVRAIREAIAAVPALEVAGAAYDGVGIPAVIGSARQAARRLVTQLPPPCVSGRG